MTREYIKDMNTRKGQLIKHITVSEGSKLRNIQGQVVLIDKDGTAKFINTTESGEIISVPMLKREKK
jgi:hypothetical protein